jgi:hypothetical protein
MPAVEVRESTESAVSVGAILAGGLAAAALTIALVTLGAAVGFASISPWSNSGVSATTFKWSAGVFVVLTAIISSAVGGYIAGRLRAKWMRTAYDEVTFRDTAHGFLAWAFATVMGVLVLGTATTSLIGSAATGVGAGASAGGAQAASASPTDYFVDTLLRPQASAGSTGASSSTTAADTRREVSLIVTRGIAQPDGVPQADRTYLSQVVAARSGISQQEADTRVTQAIEAAKKAADDARKFTAALAGWLTLALFAGAFAASAAALEGGQLRDGRWRGVVFSNYRSNHVNKN